MVRPFVTLPLEERLNVGCDCAPPGSDLVDHREGIGKPAVGAKELSATPKPKSIFDDSWRREGRLLHETGINPVSEVLQ
jgi:hypothetical protein